MERHGRDQAIIELEPAAGTPDLPTASVVGAIRSLGMLTSADELRQAAAVEALDAADAAMYRAKKSGRNRVSL